MQWKAAALMDKGLLLFRVNFIYGIIEINFSLVWPFQQVITFYSLLQSTCFLTVSQLKMNPG